MKAGMAFLMAFFVIVNRSTAELGSATIDLVTLKIYNDIKMTRDGRWK